MLPSIIPFAISIHAPLRERGACCAGAAAFLLFQSTLPYGSEIKPVLRVALPAISIHAPLRERPVGTTGASSGSDFNPRSLTGAKPTRRWFPQRWSVISIHAPLRERLLAPPMIRRPPGFQSTLPYGSEKRLNNQNTFAEISIHAPLRERICVVWCSMARENFNPRSLTGARITQRR